MADLPYPVDMTASVSQPSSTRSTASPWPGRRCSQPNTSRAARRMRFSTFTALGSQAVTTYRPIEPSDKPLVRTFYNELSDRSRRLRFLVPTNSISDEDLQYLTELDHRR